LGIFGLGFEIFKELFWVWRILQDDDFWYIGFAGVVWRSGVFGLDFGMFTLLEIFRYVVWGFCLEWYCFRNFWKFELF
jgi:hypothetical protein